MPGSEFQWLAVVFGMLTGLGVTRLLSGIASTLRSRHAAPPDWLPFLWCGSIFLAQIDYWWAIHDLKVMVSDWTYPTFLQMLISPLLLFFSAALVLPPSELKEGENHRQMFETHGHWALISLGLYHVESLVENLLYWGIGLFTVSSCLVGLFAVWPIVAFFSSRRINYAIAVVYFCASVSFIFITTDDVAALLQR